MQFTYSIFDSDPSAGGHAWPSHDDVPIEADSPEEAESDVLDEVQVQAAGLNREDDYDVGDRLYALVWDEYGTVVADPTYDLTEEDLGAEDRTGRAAAAREAIEDPEEFYDSLGHTENYDFGQLTHPTLDFRDVFDEAAYTRALADLIASIEQDLGSIDERDEKHIDEALRDMVEYGRDAADAAVDVRDALQRACDAYEAGHDDEAQRELDDAAHMEGAYGDDPATRAVRDTLYP